MGIECVYPESRLQQEKNKDHRTVSTERQPCTHEKKWLTQDLRQAENQRADYSMKTTRRDSFSDAILSAENIQIEYDDSFTLAELNQSAFDDNHINKNFSTPWTWSMTTPYSYNGEACSNNSDGSMQTCTLISIHFSAY